MKPYNDEIPVVNLTPMIDVLFLLIIFFVVGTKFIEQEREIGLKVPKVNDKGALTAAPQKKLVNVYHDGGVTLDGKVVTLGELTSQLAASRSQYQALGVLVRGDAGAQFQLVASVLNACKQAGIADLGISVTMAGNNDNVRR